MAFLLEVVEGFKAIPSIVSEGPSGIFTILLALAIIIGAPLFMFRRNTGIQINPGILWGICLAWAAVFITLPLLFLVSPYIQLFSQSGNIFVEVAVTYIGVVILGTSFVALLIRSQGRRTISWFAACSGIMALCIVTLYYITLITTP